MKTKALKTPAQSGRPDSQKDSLRNQATDRDVSNQPPLEEEDEGEFGESGLRGAKGQPSQRGAQDDQIPDNSSGEQPDRQDGAHWEQANDSAGGSSTPVPGPDTK